MILETNSKEEFLKGDTINSIKKIFEITHDIVDNSSVSELSNVKILSPKKTSSDQEKNGNNQEGRVEFAGSDSRTETREANRANDIITSSNKQAQIHYQLSKSEPPRHLENIFQTKPVVNIEQNIAKTITTPSLASTTKSNIDC